MKFTDLPSVTQQRILRSHRNEDRPICIIDLNRVQQRAKQFIDVLGAEVYYPIKTLNPPPVLGALKSIGAKLEVNNMYEVELGLHAGYRPDAMINSYPSTGEKEIAAMYKHGVRHFTIDDKDDVKLLKKHAPNSSVALRLRVDNSSGTWKLQNQGALLPDIVPLCNLAKENGLYPYALFFHSGSQLKSVDGIRNAIKMAGQAQQALREHDTYINVVNAGGGFPVKTTKECIPINTIFDAINDSLQTHFTHRPELYVEPGRYTAAESGCTLVEVCRVKNDTVYTNISVYNNLIEVVESPDFQYTVSPIRGGETKEMQVVGSTCSPYELALGKAQLPVDIRVGDFLSIDDTGAYTISKIQEGAIYGFNGAKSPLVVYEGY